MTFDLTIAGVPKELKAGSLRISRTMNGRSTATFSIISRDRTYRPPLDAAVVIERDSSRIFAGLITTPREAGFHGGVKVPIITQVTAGDHGMYADRRAVKEELPIGSLLDALEVLEGYLTGYGISLDAGQVAGPTLPALIWDYKRLSDCLNELSTLTAQFGEQFIWKIDEDLVLSMYQPSLVSAPFDLIEDGSGKIAAIVGDLTVEKTRETYANRIIVKVPAKVELGRTEVFTGDDVTDTFALDYQLTRFPYGVIRRYFEGTETPSGGETFGTRASSTAPEIPCSGGTCRRQTRSLGISAPRRTGSITRLEFDGTFEGVGIATSDPPPAPRPDRKGNRRRGGPGGPNGAKSRGGVPRAIATDPKHDRVPDALAGPGAGHDASDHGDLSSTHRNPDLTDVNIAEFGPFDLAYDVKAVLAGDTNILKSFRDLYKVWRGDLAGGAGPPRVSGRRRRPGRRWGRRYRSSPIQFNRIGSIRRTRAFHDRGNGRDRRPDRQGHTVSRLRPSANRRKSHDRLIYGDAIFVLM